MRMEIKKCCVTGHRDIPENRLEFVEQELRREILQAIEDGFTYFLSGFADGTDLVFAAKVAELKQENLELKLEAAIPYRKRLYNSNKQLQGLLWQCNEIRVHSKDYSSDCFMKRNRYMVSVYQRVIAVYDGRESGGTFATMRFARSLGKEITVINMT